MSNESLLSPFFPSPQRIAEEVETHGYAIYENAVAPEVIQKLRSFWIPYFTELARPKRKALRGNLRLGEENFVSYTDNAEWCLYRDFDFLWNRPTHQLTRRLGEEIHRIRNIAQGFSPEYGFGYSEDCYGIYISTSLYPAGSGRLRLHVDGHQSVPILQYMVPITFKGMDFESGGLYIEKDQKKMDVDAVMKPGSIVFFDGRTQHGVETIGKGKGRIASFAIPTFFKKQENLPTSLRGLERLYYGLRRRLVGEASAY